MSVQTEINRINNEVTSQADLIAQIQTALDGKASVSASGEISITENGVHDVKQYATANVNVQSEPVLLWTNASPTSSFSPQTVSVNGAGYDAYLVQINNRYGSPPIATGYIRKNYSYTQYLYSMGSGGYTGQRGISSATNTAITFTSGTNGYNEMGIPTHIWGVKFTL